MRLSLQGNLSTVPEPSSLALFCVTGVLAGIGYAWSRRSENDECKSAVLFEDDRLIAGKESQRASAMEPDRVSKCSRAEGVDFVLGACI